MSRIVEMYSENIIQYNYEFQRGYKLNKQGVAIPISSSAKIREIFESIKNKSFFGGIITLCVIKESEEDNPIEYDDHILYGNKEIFLLDGYHRTMAFKKITDIWNKNKKKQGLDLINPETWEIPIQLRVLTKNEAKKLFSEYSKGLKISKVRQEYLDVDTLKNDIVIEIMQKSELKGKVETYAVNIKAASSNNNIVTFSVLSTEIQKQFAPKTSEEVKDITSFLIYFFNTLVNEFPSSMGSMSIAERKQARLSDMSIELITWYGYISMAKYLYDNQSIDVKQKIKELKKPIEVGEWVGRFMDRENPLWNSIKRGDGRIINSSGTVSTMKKIFTAFATGEDAFNEVVKEIMEKQKVS